MSDYAATSNLKAVWKVVAALVAATVVAFLAAWFLAQAICLCSVKFHSDLADLTCGHNVVYPFILLLLLLWPISALTLLRATLRRR